MYPERRKEELRILGLLVLVIGGSLLLFAWRAPKVGTGGAFELFSREAMLLADGTKLKFTKTPGGITIQVPTQAPDKIATVVRLELKEKLPAIQLISNTAKAFEIADE